MKLILILRIPLTLCSFSFVTAQSVSWSEVTSEESGLTHEINSDANLGEVTYVWMSPLVDINTDGKLDIMAYGHHGGGAAIWFGDGDGTFTLDDSGYESRWVFGGRDPVWWDANHDGKIDGIVTESYPLTGQTFLNDGQGHFTNSKMRFRGIIADFDGDGLHQEGWKAGQARLGTFSVPFGTWVGAPPEDLPFTDGTTLEDLLGWPEGAVRDGHPLGANYKNGYTIDLDGDHQNELVVTFSGYKNGPEMFSWVLERSSEGSGVSGWTDVTTSSGLPTGIGHSFFPEDLDADGDQDLIDLGMGQWYVNDGSGQFSLATTRIFDPATRSGGSPWSGDGEFELLDFDNNGYRDLVFGGDHGTESGLFLNMGAEGFVEPADDPIPFGRRNRKFGDVDGDFDIDMVVLDRETMRLIRNDETDKRGIAIKLIPEGGSIAYLGAKVWVYESGELGNDENLIHYRQCFMERGPNRSNVLLPEFHVGVGGNQSVDVRVRFASGKIAEASGVSMQSLVELVEATPPPVKLMQAIVGESSVRLEVAGESGAPFTILKSTNLKTWQNLGTFFIPEDGGMLIYEDLSGGERAFYRFGNPSQ